MGPNLEFSGEFLWVEKIVEFLENSGKSLDERVLIAVLAMKNFCWPSLSFIIDIDGNVIMLEISNKPEHDLS